MNLPIKLICTDFDGTLFDEKEEPPIPGILQNMIRQLQSSGLLWVINTGRDLSSLMEEIARADIGIWPDYAVTVEREIYYRKGASYLSYEEWNQRCSAAHKELFDEVRQDLEDLHEWVAEHFEANVYEDIYSPFCLIAKHEDEANRIHNHLQEYIETIPNLTVVRNDVYARFSHVDFNKGTALGEIMRIEGITPDQVVVAGDHHNDLPMMDHLYAHRLIAPSNAIPEIQDKVNRLNGYISHQLAGHGVARGLEFFCFGF